MARKSTKTERHREGTANDTNRTNLRGTGLIDHIRSAAEKAGAPKQSVAALAKDAETHGKLRGTALIDHIRSAAEKAGAPKQSVAALAKFAETHGMLRGTAV